MNISIEEAKNLSTKRLLTYYKKHGRSWTKMTYDGYHGHMLENEFNKVIKYWNNIKEILNEREHIESKKNKKV